MLALLRTALFSSLWILPAASQEIPAEKKTFAITLDALEHGRIEVAPALPADGKVAAGTVLTIQAFPDSGYAFDSGYYATPGRWGKMYYESMTPAFKVIADQDKFIGASFIEANQLEGFSVIQDVVYAQPGVKKLKYDVFSPKGAQKLPGIIIIHGGGWSSNTEDIMRGLARELVKGGKYVVFSIDYRWIDTGDGDKKPNTMADIISDVYGAIAHIQEHAVDYGCDSKRLAVTGDSAGGHLAAAVINMSEFIGDGGFGNKPGIYEFLPTYMPKAKTPRQVRKEIMEAVKASAPSYGVFGGSLMKNFAGQSQDPAQLAAISPLDRIPPIKSRAVPQYLLRGTKDALITDEAVRSYADALVAAGQAAIYEQVEGANHAFFDWKPDAQTKAVFAQYGIPYAAKMKDFFDRYLSRKQ
jgi:acetyl esterase/lipase